MIEIADILDVEKYIDEFDAIIFDLDDTLYSEKEYVKSGFQAVAEFFDDQKMVFELWKAFENGGKAIDVVFGMKGKENSIKEALRIYRNHTPILHFYPGVEAMLKRISKNKKIGIITDGRPEGQHKKIEVLGLEKFVDAIVITDELGGPEYRKPNETAFRLMQEKMGIPYEKMVYVGDNMSKDFVAPKKLGMGCIFFRNADGIYKDSLNNK